MTKEKTLQTVTLNLASVSFQVSGATDAELLKNAKKAFADWWTAESSNLQLVACRIFNFQDSSDRSSC